MSKCSLSKSTSLKRVTRTKVTKLKSKTLRRVDGFTLVELLIALLITSLISIGVLKVVGTASLGLERSANEAKIGVQAVKFSSQIKYDIASSQDVFIWGQTLSVETQTTALSTLPADKAMRRCISPPSADTVKKLVTIKLKVLSDSAVAIAALANGDFVNSYRYPLVTYELHQSTSNGISHYSIWRVRCNIAEVAPAPSTCSSTTSDCYPSSLGFDVVASGQNIEKILDLGKDTSPTSYPASYSGLDFLKCPSGSCSPNTSTSLIDNYKLVIPYGGNLRAINGIDSNPTGIQDLNAQTLARRISS